MVDTPAPYDKRLELAYEAAKSSLGRQDATLGNTRSRANNVLATAAVLTTVATGVGLLNTDPDRGSVLPVAAAWILLSLMLLICTLVLYTLWTVRIWHFGPSAAEIMRCLDDGKNEDEIRKHIVMKMVHGIGQNAGVLRRRQTAFKLAAGLLTLEVVALVITLVLSN